MALSYRSLLISIASIAAVMVWGIATQGCDKTSSPTAHGDGSIQDASGRDAQASNDALPDATARDGALPDALPDAAKDAGSDGGQPDGSMGDGGLRTCAAHGGTCTDQVWITCPAGTEPFGKDRQLDCGGHCCVTAPNTSCNQDAEANCIKGTTCGEVNTCWFADTQGLECETGRVCCEWMCDSTN
ncbi:MAG: hypothetical protein J7M25_09665 [Deltaproteobacteria bacterium]|nr:hypothetical protein [Deltaproteobacteria bacterium]